MNAEQIAKVCHEANRAITAIVQDVPVQPEWADAPEDMRTSSIKGVEFAIQNPDATAEQQHEQWMADKLAAGWTYGATRDNATKKHPALRPYAELSDGTRKKDALFRAVVAALRD